MTRTDLLRPLAALPLLLLWAACPVPPDSFVDTDPNTTPEDRPPSLALCADRGPLSRPFSETLTCADEVGEVQWDVFALQVEAGDCIHIKVDNAGSGSADLLAYAQDAAGDVYGLRADYSELDDEGVCTAQPWTEFGCPDASVTASTAGVFFVAVAQWYGGCATGLADYQIHLALNGLAVEPSQFLSENDVSLE